MITIEATENEINALIQLIDAGVRASGLRGAGSAVQWAIKLEAAAGAAAKQGVPNGSELQTGPGLGA